LAPKYKLPRCKSSEKNPSKSLSYWTQIPLEIFSLDTLFLSPYTEFTQLPDFINKKGDDMKGRVFSIFLMVIIFTVTVSHAQDMGIMTGNKRGTYYQFGLNLAQLVKSRGIKLNVFDSAGSVQNVYSVYKAPGVQLGIVQSDVLAFISKIQTDAALIKIAGKTRMVFPLYNEEVHLLGQQGIVDFDDLADRVVAIGEEGSGTYLTAKILFEVADVKPRELLPIGTDEALAQLKQRKIDAMFYVAGQPVKLFAEGVTAQDKLALIPITNKSILDFYLGVEIPAKTYSWQDQMTNTIAVKAVLVSYDFRGVNCENVGKFSKMLQENLEWLRANGHPKWKSVDLNAPVKGWEQYDCVKKYLQPSQRPAPERSRDSNPVLDAIKKMFSD
jgi:TRAP transporter TAXI family solute receptor